MAKNGENLELALEGIGLVQPHSMMAEQAVLGALLLKDTAVEDVLPKLKAEMFYEQHNRAVYQLIIDFYAESRPIDILLLAENLTAAGEFGSAAEARVFLTGLAEAVPSISNLGHYAGVVEEKYIKRQLMQHAQSILSRLDDDSEADTVLETAEQQLYDIRQGKPVTTMKKMDTAIFELMTYLRNLSGENKKDYIGVPSGFSYLDHMLAGLGRSNLIILAARPGMGKTSFALNVATNVAKQGFSTMIFSLEMTTDQLTSRMLSSHGLINSDVFRFGTTDPGQWREIVTTSDELGKMPMYMNDSAAITVPEMRSTLRSLNRSLASHGEKPVGLVVVDYLQLMSGGKRKENRVQEISEITRGLKILAKDLNVPVVALSQLSRSAEKGRDDKRPLLSDLRDSGSIEQDADVVLFLYRPDYYRDEEEDESNRGKAECIVAKNRHGATGTVHMRWDGDHTRFYEYDGREE